MLVNQLTMIANTLHSRIWNWIYYLRDFGHLTQLFRPEKIHIAENKGPDTEAFDGSGVSAARLFFDERTKFSDKNTAI